MKNAPALVFDAAALGATFLTPELKLAIYALTAGGQLAAGIAGDRRGAALGFGGENAIGLDGQVGRFGNLVRGLGALIGIAALANDLTNLRNDLNACSVDSR